VSWLSFRSWVTAEEMTFGEVDGDEVVFSGDSAGDSWSGTRRQNLPPAVTSHTTYRDVRVDLTIEGRAPSGR